MTDRYSICGCSLLIHAVRPLQLAHILISLSIITTHGFIIVVVVVLIRAFLAIAVLARPLVDNGNIPLILAVVPRHFTTILVGLPIVPADWGAIQ